MIKASEVRVNTLTGQAEVRVTGNLPRLTTKVAAIRRHIRETFPRTTVESNSYCVYEGRDCYTFKVVGVTRSDEAAMRALTTTGIAR